MEDLLQDALRRAMGMQERQLLADRPDVTWESCWSDLTPPNASEAYERLIDACRLMTEDAYTCEGDAVGAYQEMAGGIPGIAMQFFAAFVATAKRKKYLPSWFNSTHIHACFRRASSVDKRGQRYIMYATELRDMRDKRGYEMTNALRLLGYLVDKAMDDKDWVQGKGLLQPYLHSNGKSRFEESSQHGTDASSKMMGNGLSGVSIVDHLIENAGSVERLSELVNMYMNSLGYTSDERMTSIPEKEKYDAQRTLSMWAKEGNPVAQYLFGKMMKDPKVVVFGKAGAQTAKLYKLWTSAALKGNAYAMAGLGLVNKDAGYMLTAITWWEKSMRVARVPEASYNIGVAYSLGAENCPVDYAKAAKWYAYCTDIVPWKSNRRDLPQELLIKVHVLGPNNNKQKGYQPLAAKNLRYVENQLAAGTTTTMPANAGEGAATCDDENAAEPVPSCALCGRQSAATKGPTRLLKCSRCGSAFYCNAICQKGHWPYHKAECNRK